MNFYKLTIIISLIIFLTGAAFIKNFTFLKSIPLAVLNIFSIENTVEINKNLTLSPKKGIYSTVWSAHSKRINNLIRVAGDTEINSIVIDVKDSDVYIDDYIKSLVIKLHEKNIYAIARIVVFQDNSQVNIHPNWYFKKQNGSLWQDSRNWYWIDPAERGTWDYNIEIGKRAIDAGFEELNFDYIRYPAFSKEEDVAFPPPNEIIIKSSVINSFADYLTSELKKYDPEIILSVDLFAYNMLNSSDLGVGQVFLGLYDYFDYISPMIYPSHYISGNFGFDNPAEYPYEVVLSTIEEGKTQLWGKSVAEAGTTTPAVVKPVFEKHLKKLRPWLQDFNIGAMYDGEMIRKEKQAIYDSGLTSGWLLWNPRNVYTEEALDK